MSRAKASQTAAPATSFCSKVMCSFQDEVKVQACLLGEPLGHVGQAEHDKGNQFGGVHYSVLWMM